MSANSSCSSRRCSEPSLGGSEDERVDAGEVVDDLADAVLGLVRDRLVGHGDHNHHATQAPDLSKRLQAGDQRRVESSSGIG